MEADEEINGIGEEVISNEIESNLINNVIFKPEEFTGFSRSNTHFMRCRDLLTEHTTSFSIGFIPRKAPSFEKN